MGTENFESVCKALIERLLAIGFKPLGIGSTRASFVRKNLIVKVPKSINYFTENITEGHVSKRSKKGIFTWTEYKTKYRIKIARTRLFYIDNIPVIVMEKVIPLGREEADSGDFSSKKAEWVSDMVGSGDGHQIGRDRFGELKAFDFGHLYPKFRATIEKKANKAQTPFGEEGYSIDYNYFNKLGLKDSYGTNSDSFVEEQMHLLKFV